MHETTASSGLFSPPVLVYLGMGIMSARILLEGQTPRVWGFLVWAQYLVRAGSIVLLWPLALFLEKFEAWAKHSTGEEHERP